MFKELYYEECKLNVIYILNICTLGRTMLIYTVDWIKTSLASYYVFSQNVAALVKAPASFCLAVVISSAQEDE